MVKVLLQVLHQWAWHMTALLLSKWMPDRELKPNIHQPSTWFWRLKIRLNQIKYLCPLSLSLPLSLPRVVPLATVQFVEAIEFMG